MKFVGLQLTPRIYLGHVISVQYLPQHLLRDCQQQDT